MNDEQIKEKRKQRLMKAGYEARIRARKEKEREREAKEELERQEERERTADPVVWANRVRREHSVRVPLASTKKWQDLISSLTRFLLVDRPSLTKSRTGRNDEPP